MVGVKFVWILVKKLLVQMNCHLVRLRCCNVLEVIRTAIIAYWDMMKNLLLVLPWCEFPWWQYSPKEVFSDKCHRPRSCPCPVPATRRTPPPHTSPCPGPTPSHPPSCSAHTCTRNTSCSWYPPSWPLCCPTDWCRELSTHLLQQYSENYIFRLQCLCALSVCNVDMTEEF